MARRRTKRSNALAFDGFRLMTEAGAVMAMRSGLMAGRAIIDAEFDRMCREKPAAFIDAAQRASWAAAWSLARNPFDLPGASIGAANAWTRAVTGKARANRKRLSRPRKARKAR